MSDSISFLNIFSTKIYKICLPEVLTNKKFGESQEAALETCLNNYLKSYQNVQDGFNSFFDEQRQRGEWKKDDD